MNCKGRGGWRQNAGRKAAWRHGETQTIRVPVALKEQLLEIGKKLDSGEFVGNPTDEELEQVLYKWQVECDAQPEDAPEWQKVRQLLGEIDRVLATESIGGCRHGHGHASMAESGEVSDMGMRRGRGHGRRHHHHDV